MIIIKPTCGLCNRLCVIFSWYVKSQRENKKLFVIWNKTSVCTEMFLKYFQPIEGILFEEKISYRKIDYTGYMRLTGYPEDYSKLRLLPYMQKIVDQKRLILQNNYVAVHIRRTDYVTMAKASNNYTTDEQFMKFIDIECKDKMLYIATDNKETYDMFKKKYNKLVKLDYHPVVLGLRKTTLQDSIIDLYMCVYSNKFMGSGSSSFTNLIYKLRKLYAIKNK